jgi:hypothetical protein
MLISKKSYLILTVVDTGLHEAVTNTTYLYYIVYIFNSLSWRLYEILILTVILRTVVENTSSPQLHKLSPLNIVGIVLLGALTTAGFGMFVASIAYLLKDGFSHSDLTKYSAEVSLAYDSLYLVTVIFAAFIGVVVLIKERSKVSPE